MIYYCYDILFNWLGWVGSLFLRSLSLTRSLSLSLSLSLQRSLRIFGGEAQAQARYEAHVEEAHGHSTHVALLQGLVRR